MASSKKNDPPSGLSEGPQAPFEGVPLSSDVSSWAQEIARESDRPETLADRTTAEWRAKEAEREEKKAAKVKRAKAQAKKAADPTVGEKRTGGGTIIGGSNDPKERVAAGLNPVSGLDISLEDAGGLSSTAGVTATVSALANLIEHGRDEMKGDIWVPHRPERPDMDEEQAPFAVVSEFEPKGDQPTAIKDLVDGLSGTDLDGAANNDAERPANPNRGERTQVLLGVTGSGKTFTMAKVIEETQRPALILAPNKTLAAQLFQEMKSFFPDNAVEYFVSYYDYYQPEAYVPRSDTFIEKESSVNEQIDRMRRVMPEQVVRP